MNFISWNCRGLGHPKKLLALKELVRKYKPEVIFLIETLVLEQRIQEIKVELGFDACFAINAVSRREGYRRSGGIACLWKNTDAIEVTSYSLHHIDMLVRHVDGAVWRFTGYYGHPERENRMESWNLLQDLSRRSNLPWIIMGDFNDLLSVTEKIGGSEHPSNLIEGFRHCLEASHLIDIPLSGGQFTWEKSRGSPSAIFEKLDRACANAQWVRMFPNHNLLNLVTGVSDHNPIFLKVYDNIPIRRTKRFRFENVWLQEEGLKEVVQRNWDSDCSVSITEKIQKCALGLAEWGQLLGKNFKESKAQIYDNLRQAQQRADMSTYVVELKNKLNSLLLQEDTFWKQRAKSFWLKHGDLNTKYFHAQASSRKRVNHIPMLQSVSGDAITDEGGKAELVKEYFHGLYSDSTAHDFAAFEGMKEVITEDDNRLLLDPFTHEEFKLALDQMHPDKSPGPDGMNAAFFQKFWDLIGEDVVNNCQQWIRQGRLPANLNNTFIVLIAKIDKSVLLKDFRPIALCNVLYKILAKVLANRLKIILPRIISHSQSAFVPGRSICDNIIVAFELIHCMKRKIRGKYGDVALKLDISKAYDRVDWNFLKHILCKMGFARGWVNLIMMCVTSVRYKVLLNGQEVGPILPKRGLRQGDPLSPYLFILCAEGLSFLLRKAEDEGSIHGLRVVRRAPSVSHLLFADDSFFFFRATSADCKAIKQILGDYEKASGQAVNLHKSGIFFSSNVDDNVASDLQQILGVSTPLNHGRYLGLPSFIGKKKKQIFSFLKERIGARIQNWKTRLLSRAGKEILLKSVVQAMPTYCMNVFLLPLSICDELQKMMNSFWWGSHHNGTKKIHWLAWNRMCIPKGSGGLGFRMLHLFNLAMLAKQGWNLIHNPSSLPAQLLKARYYPRSGFLEASEGYNPSFIWKSLIQARNLLALGTRWRVGNGASISVWNDPWLPGGTDFYVQTPMLEGTEYLQVKDLMHESENKWDVQFLNGLLCSVDVERIIQIPLSSISHQDRLMWDLTKDGCYSVKTGYRLALENFGPSEIATINGPWNKVWQLKIPPKIKEFMWRACRGIIPTCEALRIRGITAVGNCCVCNKAEDVNHALLYCPRAASCWRRLRMDPRNLSFIEFLTSIFQLSQDVAGRVCVVAWSIWNARNKLLWQRKWMDSTLIVESANKILDEWRQVHVQGTNSVSALNSVDKWVKPPPGWVKCNFDAATFEHERRTGYGIVIRNVDGVVLCCKSGFFEACYKPIIAEALALREAVHLIQSSKFNSVIFESDCLPLVQAYKASEYGINELGLILSDCKAATSQLQEFCIVWAKRGANMVADTLSKNSVLLANPSRWDVTPEFLSELVNLDNV